MKLFLSILLLLSLSFTAKADVLCQNISGTSKVIVKIVANEEEEYFQIQIERTEGKRTVKQKFIPTTCSVETDNTGADMVLCVDALLLTKFVKNQVTDKYTMIQMLNAPGHPEIRERSSTVLAENMDCEAD